MWQRLQVSLLLGVSCAISDIYVCVCVCVCVRACVRVSKQRINIER